WAYSIDSVTGRLTNVGVFPSGGVIPQCISVDAQSRFAYVANASSNTVSAFVINSQTGGLIATAGSPFSAGRNPRSTVVTPDGRFVYAGDNLSHNVSGYTVNATTGALTALPGSPFPVASDPNVSINVDASGRFLYMPTSAGVVAMAINQTTGVPTT